MSEIEDILERATITFPVPLDMIKAEKLLLKISEGIRGEVLYRVQKSKSFVYDEKEKESYIFIKNKSVKRIIIKDTKSFASEFVELVPSDKDNSKYSSMKFEIIPGYTVSEHRPEVVKLWDDVRLAVNDYFAKMKSSKD